MNDVEEKRKIRTMSILNDFENTNDVKKKRKKMKWVKQDHLLYLSDRTAVVVS
jgi:hypothetical protein